ncbi:MAG: hypothetical protein ACKVK8_01260 [Rhodospirillales bacterium]|jgi:taurine dioxygenase
MAWDVAVELITALRTFATEEQFIYRYRSTKGAATLRDDRCTMHCPGPFDMVHHQCVMHRATIEGGLPF